MEVDDFFEIRNYSKPFWVVKDKILLEFHNELSHGDKVYISKPYNEGVKITASYLESIGCTRVNTTEEADKIVGHRPYFGITEEKPKSVPTELLNRHKYVDLQDFVKAVRKFKVESKPKIEFTPELYLSIAQMLSDSSNKINVRLAVHTLMTIDWTGIELLLHAITLYYHSSIFGGNLSKLNGWSNFANSYQLDWKTREPSAARLLDALMVTTITLEQIKLIKLIKK